MTSHSSLTLFDVDEGGYDAALTTTKVCTKCGEEKEVTEFYKSGGRFFKVCKACDTARRRKLYAENREYFIAYSKQWAKDHPIRAAIQRNRRRALKMNAEGDFTAEEFIELCDTYGNVCLACGISGVTLTADHVIPLARNGTNDIGNIQPLCLSCNCKKYTHTTDYREPVAS